MGVIHGGDLMLFKRKKKQANTITATDKESNTIFNGFVLLDAHVFDPTTILHQLKQDWDIEYEIEGTLEKDPLIIDVDGMMACITFIDAAVPDGEAEYYAKTNYLWKNGEEIVKTHVAQIMVSVMLMDHDVLDGATLYVKVVSSVLKHPHVLGVYTSLTVFQPELYQDFAASIQSGEIPLNNLVYFGLYANEHGMNAYTYGMRMLNKEEMEILNADMEAIELRELLFALAYYVVEADVELQDGETIGFSEEQKLPISYSKGVGVDGNSLKIKVS